MGLLDKIPFFKKKDDFSDMGLGDKPDGFTSGYNSQDMPNFDNSNYGQQDNMGLPQQQQQQPQGFSPQQQNFQAPSAPEAPSFQSPGNIPSFSQQSSEQGYPHHANTVVDKELEIISSKLDALRATLESMNQRIANLEAIARGAQEESRPRRYKY